MNNNFKVQKKCFVSWSLWNCFVSRQPKQWEHLDKFSIYSSWLKRKHSPCISSLNKYERTQCITAEWKPYMTWGNKLFNPQKRLHIRAFTIWNTDYLWFHIKLKICRNKLLSFCVELNLLAKNFHFLCVKYTHCSVQLVGKCWQEVKWTAGASKDIINIKGKTYLNVRSVTDEKSVRILLTSPTKPL